ncbi:MAG TPA: hypothetical protein VHI52_06360 [Verrucomicrobiae bacterium]|nr:hypothetical protein [Verrucomicrobiae bacterium]
MRSQIIPLWLRRTVAQFAAVAGLVGTSAPAQPWVAAEWKLQEGQGELARDSSGHGNDGSLHRTQWSQVEGGASLEFTASAGSYVSVSNSPSLNLAEAVSIDLWVKTYGRTGNWQGLVAKRDDSNREEKSQYHLTLTVRI